MNTTRLTLLSAFVLLTAVPEPAHMRRVAAPLVVSELRVEYLENPIGLDVAKPRFGWQLKAADRDVMQSSYEIQVATDPVALASGRNPVWASDGVASDASTHVEYGGPALKPATRYFWRVRVRDNKGRESAWSTPAFWETGLVDNALWTARWVEAPWPEIDSLSQPAPMFRRGFTLRAPVRSARVYVTSHGLYELRLNGQRVGDAVLTPGWTSYNKRLQYQTYDVTRMLRTGGNAIGATLGDGWYRGNIGFNKQRNYYGRKLGLLLQLRVVYADGGESVIATDSAWTVTPGPIRSSDIYNGETYDARLEQTDWSMPSFDGATWQPVHIGAAASAGDHLAASMSPPVRRIQEITPAAILHTPAGQTVVDMGQNMVGWVRLRVRGPAGATVTLRHAEVLDKDGNFYVANLRRAAQTDHYTLKGGGLETYEPTFTFHGFRYVALEGFPGEPTKESVTGIVVHSDMQQTGEFETSNPLLNQLQHNIVWGQKGNFVDVPTDCPQRDERLGWTGDAQVFSRTAAFNRDVAAFFTKWLRDVAADQHPAGSVPHVIPNVLGGDSLHNAGSAGWSDAATVIPWNMYLAYGDRRLLAEQYPSMRAWVEFIRREAGEDYLWNTGFHYGDWLAYATTRADYPGATTGKDLIATAYYARSVDILAHAARVLGNTDDAQRYEELRSKIVAAFDREFVTSTGRVGENTQTAYVLALSYNLLPDSLRASAASRLAENVRAHGNHLTTGFLGTPDLTHVLSSTGHTDVAYTLLNQQTYPSWLYPVKRGATTIWERWDGVRPDGNFQDPGMNSFNHYAYGAIGDWMYRVVAGLDLDPGAPGYKHVIIAPQPGGGLTSAKASLLTLYGRATSAWQIRDGQLVLDVEVPANATATVRLANAMLAQVMESGLPVERAPGVHRASQDASATVLTIGSGSYRFTYPWAAGPAAGSTSTSSAGGVQLAATLPVIATGSLRPMPLDWIDRDTHHRVIRLSRRDGDNSSFYFHNDPFIRDSAGDKMVFYGSTSAGRQIFVVNLRTLGIEQITNRSGSVSGEILAPVRREVIYQRGDTVFATHVESHATGVIALLPNGLGAHVATINANETTLAGVYADPKVREILASYPSKSGYFDRIYEAHARHTLFTVDVRTGAFREIYRENEWLNHLQFSPTNPNLLMFCHEGPWHLLDRIWTMDIRDTVPPRRIHTRAVEREIAGHEFFSADGETIWYDLQIPRGVTFHLAGYNLATGERPRFEMTRDEWSIHFSASPDGRLFAGDGGDSTQVARARNGRWLYLFRPSGARLVSEKLVNMSQHDYRLEPNVHFMPDGKWVVFRANFEGESQVYAVEVAPAAK